MTPEFKAQAVHILDGWKGEGLGPISAIRALETLCGKNAEEFHPDGQRLVEEVYGGRFSPALGGAGLNFTPKPKEVGKDIVFQPVETEAVASEPIADVEPEIDAPAEKTEEPPPPQPETKPKKPSKKR